MRYFCIIALRTELTCTTNLKWPIFLGVCKRRNPTRNTRNPTRNTRNPTRNTRNPTRNTRNPPGTPGTLPGTPGTLPGTPGTPPGTPGTPPGTRWNTSYEAAHVFLYKFTCFALNSGVLDGYDLYFHLYFCFFK